MPTSSFVSQTYYLDHICHCGLHQQMESRKLVGMVIYKWRLLCLSLELKIAGLSRSVEVLELFLFSIGCKDKSYSTNWKSTYKYKFIFCTVRLMLCGCSDFLDRRLNRIVNIRDVRLCEHRTREQTMNGIETLCTHNSSTKARTSK